LTTLAVAPVVGAVPGWGAGVVGPGIIREPLRSLEISTVSLSSSVAPVATCVVWSLAVSLDLIACTERLWCTLAPASVVVEVVVAVVVVVTTAQEESLTHSIIALSLSSSSTRIVVVADYVSQSAQANANTGSNQSTCNKTVCVGVPT